MSTTKTHIAKQIVKGKIITTKTECGLKQAQRAGRYNYIVNTATFKKIALNDKPQVCEKCLAKAKEQGRI